MSIYEHVTERYFSVEQHLEIILGQNPFSLGTRELTTDSLARNEH